MLGYIALEVYKKDKKQGQNLIRQLISESGKQPALTPQVQAVQALLMQNIDAFAMEILVRSIIKADANIGLASFQSLAEMAKNGKLPSDFNQVQTMKTIIQGLSSEARSGREVSSVLEEAFKYAASLQDKDLNKIVERARLVKGRQQMGPRTHSSSGRSRIRGASGTGR